MADQYQVYREYTSDKVFKMLKGLGQTPEEIAYKLDSLKIRGKRNSPCYCPIAVYLGTMGTSFEARPYLITSAHGFEYRTPSNVAVFMRQFDSGMYSFLEGRTPEDVPLWMKVIDWIFG